MNSKPQTPLYLATMQTLETIRKELEGAQTGPLTIEETVGTAQPGLQLHIGGHMTYRTSTESELSTELFPSSQNQAWE